MSDILGVDQNPKEFEYNPKKLEQNPKKFEYNPKKLEYNPNKLEQNPKKLEYNPKKLEQNPMNLEQNLMNLEQNLMNLDQSPMNLEQNFKNEVASYPGGEHVLNCYLCGTCTAGCPVSEITAAYNPRNIMRMILLGNREGTLNSGEIWRCSQCHTCVAHCPQDVRFADIVRVLREIAQKEGIINENFVAAINEIDIETRKQRLEKVNKLIMGER